MKIQYVVVLPVFDLTHVPGQLDVGTGHAWWPGYTQLLLKDKAEKG